MRNQTTLLIREIQESDIELLANTFCFPWSSVEKQLNKWSTAYQEHMLQQRRVYVVEEDEQLLGYVSLVFASKHQPFKEDGVLEIHDLWIAEERRKQGLATALITHLEAIGRELGYREIGMGVGLYCDYGSAQRLYIKLGYVPDTHGITYCHLPVVPGQVYPVDDELVLWLKKAL